jgi:peptide/nickel transport system permease protein
LSSAESAWEVVTGTWPGRVGIALIVLLALLSVVVLLTMPLDFGRVWNDPSSWADLPKAVPPVWSAYVFGIRPFTQQELVLRETVAGPGYEVLESRVSVDSDLPPSHLVVKVHSVSFRSGPPAILVDVVRPDGIDVPMARITPPGPRPGEPPPYIRYAERPYRLELGQGSEGISYLTAELSRRYGAELTGTEPPASLLFGRPDPLNKRLEVLRGTYAIRATVYRSDGDSIGSVSVVLGGSHYGLIGTDGVGRDLLLGLLYGFPVALGIGIFASVLVTSIGAVLGVLSGYYRGKVETVIQRAADVVANVPLLPILIFLSFVLRPSILTIMTLLIAFSWPGLAIVVRSMVLQIVPMPFVEASRAIGSNDMRVMFMHVLPQLGPYLLAQTVFFAPSAILAEAGLSFLGLGDPSIPTWGQILELGFRTGAVFTGYWWWVIPPGFLLALTGLAFASLAMGLEPLAAPRLRRA